MAEFDWTLAATILGGLATAGLTTWLTAFLSFRSGVRQKVWQSVYEEKRTEFRKFVEVATEFGTLLNLFATLQRGAQASGVDFTGRALFVLDASPRTDQDASFFSSVKEELAGARQATGEKQRQRVLGIFEALRGHNLMHLETRYLAIRNQVNRLALVSYDPRVPEEVEAKAFAVRQTIGRKLVPFEGADIQQLADDYNNSLRHALRALRSDLDDSADSLGKATRHAPEWAALNPDNA